MREILSNRQIQLLRWINKFGADAQKIRKINQLTLGSLLFRKYVMWLGEGLAIAAKGEKVLKDFSIHAATERKISGDLTRTVERLLLVSRGIGKRTAIKKHLKIMVRPN